MCNFFVNIITRHGNAKKTLQYTQSTDMQE